MVCRKLLVGREEETMISKVRECFALYNFSSNALLCFSLLGLQMRGSPLFIGSMGEFYITLEKFLHTSSE